MTVLLGVPALWCGTLGCEALPPEELPGEGRPIHASDDSLQSANGLSPNGLITNGLITNGLITNGLITNGLSTNGVSTASFGTWFDSTASAYSDMVMKYVVACAYAEGSSLTYQAPSTGITYTWPGLLGLTPGWASGQPITPVEEQLITGCLAAHVNKYGIQMEVSVRGATAVGTLLPVTQSEATVFSEKEAAFFGNLINGAGVFACNDRNLTVMESSARACGLASQGNGASVECPPIRHVGTCKSICDLDESKTHYTSCVFNGVTYKPLTTRIRPADIYRCGDGVCQLTESCDPDPRTGSNRYDACESDCGNCP
ncbi:hypothetical protein HPC49_16955 [Pyxidicoccus fallax]|uniref:Uncharacterized protein n=1 Tax=Pyxidicoccus fallax TaxID=394095 RepID=A0A848L5R7_9BACT|nr:hypothetical protein [Pyxidicoccus fallax]NMO14290.1 hypothetical protein [Pyxidicoccus fallax]NPC79905.1 hypothetical protein [Pyxidicoccus fallax]